MTQDFSKLNIQDVPLWYARCFNNECPRKGECLRHYIGSNDVIPDETGPAVYPAAWKNGNCQMFRTLQTSRHAWGFNTLLADVKAIHINAVKQKMRAFLGSQTSFSRANLGKITLPPEKQAELIKILNSFGYTENLQFDHYVDVPDFT